MPGGDSGEHRLRYLAPDGGTKFLRVYMENNGSWERVEYETAGSYLVIPVRGSSVRIAVVSTVEIWWVWAAAVLLLALIVFLIVHFTRRAARKVRQRKEGAPEETAAPAAEPNTPAQAAAPAEPDPELLARALSAEERLARAEEELRMLRESSASGAVAVAERPKKRVRWWIPVIVVVVLLAIAAGVFFVSRNFGTELEAYRILNAYAQKDPLAMTLRVDAKLDGQTIGLDAEICKTKVEGKTVTCLQRDGVQLFYAGETVYLENGRAFSVGGDYPDYAELLPQAAELYRLVNVSASTSGTQKTYRLTAKDENADALVRILLPELPADSTVRTLEAALTADGQKPIRLTFSAELTGGTSATLNAELSFSEGVTTAPEIPEAVRSAITSGKPAEAGLLTDELFELLKGWAARCAGESMSADLTLSADCGPVVVNDTLRIDRERVSGQTITAVGKNALTLYLSGDRLCDGSGNAASDQLSGLADSAELIDAAGGLKDHAGKVISGGPMMGFAMYDLHVPCVKTSSSLLCMQSDPVSDANAQQTACINCGRCVSVCPGHVIPARLATFAQRGDMESFQKFDGMECCECGCCSYICPAKRPLTQSIKSMRKMVLASRRKK